MSGLAISLEALEIIDAIDRRGSFASAAEELGKVPSALSYSIQKLEEKLDISLFSRQGRRSILTPAGKVILKEGRQLLLATKKIEQEAKRTATGWETHIRIAVEALVDTAPVMKALQQFLAQHSSIEIEINEEVMGGAWEALSHDRADIIIGAVAPIPQSQGIRTEPYGKVQRVIAVAASHPLAQFWGAISTTELARHRQVVIHDSSVVEIPRSSEIYSENQRFYVANMGQKIEAQRQGIGFGFLPYELIKQYLASGEMKILNVEGNPGMNQGLIAWKLANQGKGLKELRQILTQLDNPEAQTSFEY